MIKRLLLAFFLSNLILSAATASVLWDGDASLGTGIFKVLNLEGAATLTTTTDATYGNVWKFYKPKESPRCEVHAAKGFQAGQDDVFYLGWRCKLSMAGTTKTYAIFQWKSYPTDVVNHPVMLRTLDGKFVLEHYNPDGAGGRTKTVLWEAPIVTNSWVTFVVNIKASTSNTGYVKFWYNGVQQTFKTGSNTFVCTTLTSDYCDPKWGVYNDAGVAEVTNYVDDLKIATTYSEAAPTSQNNITLYQNYSYTGWNASFGEGSYTTAAILAAGGVDNDASSIRVPNGLQVTLYSEDNFAGNSLVLTADNAMLGDSGFNDMVSSMKIIRLTNTSIVRSGEPDYFNLRAYPVPVKEHTTISYNLGKPANVNLCVFDETGKLVKALINGYQFAGSHSCKFDASSLPSGSYLIRMKAGDKVRTLKMIKKQ